MIFLELPLWNFFKGDDNYFDTIDYWMCLAICGLIVFVLLLIFHHILNCLLAKKGQIFGEVIFKYDDKKIFVQGEKVYEVWVNKTDYSKYSIGDKVYLSYKIGKFDKEDFSVKVI